MTWRCILPIHRPTTPRKGLPTAPLPTLPPPYQRENGYIIIAALSARPCVHPSSVLFLDFRLLLPPRAVCVLFIVCVCPCGDSGDLYRLTTPPPRPPPHPLERVQNPVLTPFLVSEKGRSKAWHGQREDTLWKLCRWFMHVAQIRRTCKKATHSLHKIISYLFALRHKIKLWLLCISQ